MWKSHEMFKIHIVIENLSAKFHEIESSFHGFLRKSFKENERILQQETNLTSQFFHNLLREQNHLETHMKQLSTMGQNYNDQISQLKSLLSAEPRSSQSPRNSTESFQAYSYFLQTQLSSLKTKVFSIPELNIDGFEASTINRIDNCFQETHQEMSSIFSQLFELTRENGAEPALFKRVEEVLSSNLPSFTGLEFSMNSIKAKVVQSLGEFDTFAISYNKEANVLRDTIEQMKLQMAGLLKEAKSDTFRPTSPGMKSRGLEDSTLSQQVRRCCSQMSQLLADSTITEQNRNKLVGTIKEEIKTFREDIKSQIKETSKHITFLKENNQRLSAAFSEENLYNGRGRSHGEDSSDDTRNKQWSSGRSNKPNSILLSKSATALPDKRTTFLSPPKSPLSMGSVGSPLQTILKSGQSKKLFNTISGGEKFFAPENVVSPVGANGSYLVMKTEEGTERVEDLIDYDLVFKTLAQKLGYLELSIKNLIVSSGKLASLFVKFTREEELALGVYEKDKQSLENTLNSFKNFVSQTHENVKSGNQARRARSQDTLRKKDQNLVIGNKQYFVTEEDKAISKEEEDKRASPTFKVQSRSSKNGQRSKNGDSPAGFFSEEKRLTGTLQVRSAERSDEKGQLDEEKKKYTTKDLVKKVDDLSSQKENLTKENLQLLKVIKKLHRKAEDRKKNLKQLFQLMTEKEKEIEQFKNSMMKRSVSENSGQDRYKDERNSTLDKEIKKKEKELKKLEETIEAKNKTIGVERNASEGQKTRSGDKKMLNEHLRELDKRLQRLEDVLANLPEESEVEVEEVQEMISLLNREKELALEKLNGLKEVASPLREGSNDVEYLRGKLKEQEELLRMVESEKNDYENRCQDLMSDLESAQEHKKKIEQNYNEEIRLLNDKIQELSHYIQELEAKNTQRLRDSMGSEKYRGFLASIGSGDEDVREENKKLKAEIRFVISDIQNILEEIEAGGDDNYSISEKLKSLYNTLMEREEEEENPGSAGNPHGQKIHTFSKGSESATETLTREKAQLEEFVSNLSKELKQTESSNKKILEEIGKLKQEIETHKNLNAELKANLKTAENLNTQLKQDLQKLTKGLQGQLEKHDRLISKGDNGQDYNSRLLHSLQGVFDELENLRRSEMGYEIRGMQAEKKKSSLPPPDGKGAQERLSEVESLLVRKESEMMSLKEEMQERAKKISSFENVIVPNKDRSIQELKAQLKEAKEKMLILQKTVLIEQGVNEISGRSTNRERDRGSATDEAQEKLVKELQEEIADKKKKITELEMNVIPGKNEEIRRLENEVERNKISLQTQEQVLEKVRLDAERKVNELREELGDANRNLEEMMKHNRQILKEKDEVRSQAEKEQGKYEKELSELKIAMNASMSLKALENDRLVDEKAQLDRELEALRKENRKFGQEKAQLNGNYEDALKNLKEKNQELQNVKGELREARRQYEELQIIKGEYEQNMNSKIRELDSLKKQQAEIQEKAKGQNQAFETRYQSLELANANLQSELDYYKSLNESANKEEQRMKQNLQELSDKYSGLQREVNRLTAELEEKENLIADLKKQFKEEQENMKNQLGGETGKLQMQIEEQEEKLRKLEESLHGKNQEISAKELELNLLKRKVESLQEEISREKNRREDLEVQHQEELKAVEKEVSQRMGMSLNAISEKENELKEKYKEIKTRLTTVEEERDELKEQVKNMKIDFENIQSHLQANINELNRRNQELVEKHEEARTADKKVLVETQERNELMEKEIDKLTTDLSKTETANFNFKKKKEEEIENLKVEYDRKIRDLNNELLEVQEQYQGALKNIAEVQEDNIRLVGECEEERAKRFETEEKSVKSLLKQKTLEIENLNTDHEREVTGLQEELKTLQTELDKVNDERKMLEEQVNSKENELSEKENQLSNLRDQYDNLTQRSSEAQKQIESFGEKIQGLEGVISQKERDITGHNENIMSLNENLKNLRTDFEEVSRQRDDFVHKLEKLGNQKEDLEIKYQSMKDEKRSLNENISRLKQEVGTLTSSKKSNEQTIEEGNQKMELLGEFAWSFRELMQMLPPEKQVERDFQDKEQIAEAVKEIKQGFFEKNTKITQLAEEIEVMKKEAESSMKNFVGESERRLQETTTQISATFSREREDLQHSMNAMKEDMDRRLLKICHEIEDILRANNVEVSAVDEDLKERVDLLETEKVIYSHMISVRMVVEGLSAVKQENLRLKEEFKTSKTKEIEEQETRLVESEKQRTELQGENQKLQNELQEKNRELDEVKQRLDQEIQQAKRELQTMNETYKEREVEIEKIRGKLEKSQKEKPSDFDIPSFDLVDDGLDEERIKNLMEDTFKVERRAEERSDTENIRYGNPLQEEIRELKEENEKLDIEYRQLRSQHELLQGCNEELKTEITEKEDEVRKMEYQMAVLKEEFAKMEKEKNQTTIAHEKQHIRMMFIKFMESALQGTKEAPELLKYLLALLDLPDSNKNQIIENFKSKTNKKSAFKIFN